MDRVYYKRTPEGPRLRLWTPPDAPSGAPSVADLTIEWGAGQPGHPSSYGLLGGSLCEGPTQFADIPDGPTFADAGRTGGDRVDFGLLDEYRAAILKSQPNHLYITTAAHSLPGSSPFVFGLLATQLLTLLRTGIPDDEQRLWRVSDSH